MNDKDCFSLGTLYIFAKNSHDQLKKVSGGLAQSEERVVRNDEAPGSKPGFSIVISKGQIVPWYSWLGHQTLPLTTLPWLSWQSIRLLIEGSPVRALPEALISDALLV